jgi:peroxiredoxin
LTGRLHGGSADSSHRPAPRWQVSQWLNTPTPPTLEALRGRVVVLEAFQMLCPGCVSHALPQAQRVHALFPEVAVIGLHTVFEHHAAMTPTALAAFVHEYRLSFPIAVDAAAADGPVPLTMRAYGLQGTPGLVLIDRDGYIRLQHVGRIDDLALGAAIATVLADRATPPVAAAARARAGCDDDRCPVPGA